MSVFKNLFCSAPFRNLFINHRCILPSPDPRIPRLFRPTGFVTFCCVGWMKGPPIGYIPLQCFDEVWNCDYAQEVRASILDGSFKFCSKEQCPFLKTVTFEVTRKEDVKNPELQEVISKNLTELPYGPREISCNYDQSCNLSCPSCRRTVIIEKDNEEQILSIQKKIEQEAIDVEVLTITGSGDPFGSPYFRKWLMNMDISKMPDLRKIMLFTNAQLWNRVNWNKIPPSVRRLITSAIISIDGTIKETYEENRRGGSFEKLLENLEFISFLKRLNHLKHVKIRMVVQDNNFMEMPDFIRMGKQFGFDIVDFGVLRNRGSYSPEEYRARAVHLPNHPRYKQYIQLLEDKIFSDPIVLLGDM